MFVVEVFPVRDVVCLPIGVRLSVDKYGNVAVECFGMLPDGKRVSICTGNSTSGRVECRDVYDVCVDLRVCREIGEEIVRECESMLQNTLTNIDSIVNTCRILLRQLQQVKT